MSKPESADRTSQPRSSAPPAPATFDTEFPSLRPPQHKTLRVVAAPHAEAMSSTSTSSTAVPSPVAQLPSRKPSQASLTRPATPASELISDNASITSTSISQSRASSPPPPMPPAVVGSAPVRQTTKNQQKKQRKESKKEQEKSLITAPAEEKEIGPIVGRKKKQKTRVVSTQAEDSAPSASRPVSPGKETNLEEAETTITTEPEAVEASPVVASPVEARPVEAALAVTSPNDPSPAEPTSAEAKTLAKGKGKAALSQPPSDKAAPSDVGPVENAAAPYTGPYAFPQPPTMKSILNSTRSANLLVSDLVKRGDLDPSTHSFFNPSVGANQRFDFTDEDFADMESKVKLTTQDQMALAQGRAVRLVHPEDGTSSNAVVTPGGCFLRGLSDEKEDRFLELEQQIADTPEATKYTPARHVGENSFFMVGGRVVQSGPGAMVGASAGTQAVDGTYLWTSSKMRIDEALNYINQFVLPALPKGSGSGNGRGPGPGAKTNPANTDTGRAPDPSSYTQYIIPGTGSSTASPSTSNMTANFTADVAGVMHYMASGSTSRLDPSPPLGTVDELSMTAQAYPRQPSLQLMQEASGADADADADGDEDGEGFTSDLPQNVPLLTAFEAETAMINARRELEGLEKKLSALVKRNRKGVTTAAGVE
ncbi:MAG: transcriptional repressor general negative regulator of transcription subunit 4 [Thelocarpon superellum]|nr:MAG: transcriptional repressor general negative regulator of transcription subunit 4 [Thelocarpon superellum]